MKSLFLTFEGPEGSGKSTIIKLIYEKLVEEGYSVICTREPGGIDIAEQIREVILKKENTAMDSKTEALLYAASRRQHLVEKVIPALNQGYIVLCDRFVDSSLAYQGVGRGLGIDEVYQMNLFAIGDVLPDLTLFFDCPVEVGLRRIHSDQQREVNRLDLESLQFHHHIYQGYLEICQRYSDRIKKIDANQTVEEVFHDAYQLIEEYICHIKR